MAQTFPRKTLTLFGTAGTTDDFEQFGSTAINGTPTYTKDVATIQALTAAWNNGWRPALVTAKAPVLQDMNGVMYVHSYEQCYTLCEGVPEWDNGTTYNKGSIVKVPYASTSGARLYVSLIDANTGNALPSPPSSNSDWQYCGDLTNVPNLQNYGAYRRPNLVWIDATHIDVSLGIVTGGATDGTILFPDGTVRTEATQGLRRLNIAQVAALSGSKQSGIRTGSAAANTWYALYAVKATDTTTDWVMVADTVLPLQANYATLNSNFGTNGWVYLGVVPYGDNSGSTTAFPKFIQSGNNTTFYNVVNGSSTFFTTNGVRLATSGGATSLTWTYAAGTSLSTSGQVPGNLDAGIITTGQNAGSQIQLTDAASTFTYALFRGGSSIQVAKVQIPLVSGIIINPGTTSALDIMLSSFTDTVLGIGSNPLL